MLLWPGWLVTCLYEGYWNQLSHVGPTTRGTSLRRHTKILLLIPCKISSRYPIYRKVWRFRVHQWHNTSDIRESGQLQECWRKFYWLVFTNRLFWHDWTIKQRLFQLQSELISRMKNKRRRINILRFGFERYWEKMPAALRYECSRLHSPDIDSIKGRTWESMLSSIGIRI